jgi:very-short-patch-repair endonuclease
MEGGHIAMNDGVLDVCESIFEKEVGGELVKRGYRLRPQVPVAGYRLDFVVEGQGDRRLAIECDGDPYHGPDRWAADMKRQKALERLGWIFWRVWGSHWYSDRSGCIQDLIATLDQLKIVPLGADSPPFEWTEHRVVVTQEPTVVERLAVDEFKSHIGMTLYSSQNLDFAPAPPLDITEKPDVAPAPLPDITERPGNGRVRAGDYVVVRYGDTNRIRRILLSSTENRPDDGVVHVSQPLGRAVLGASVDDEIQFPHREGMRSAVIERIERRAN